MEELVVDLDNGDGREDVDAENLPSSQGLILHRLGSSSATGCWGCVCLLHTQSSAAHRKNGFMFEGLFQADIRAMLMLLRKQNVSIRNGINSFDLAEAKT